MSTLVPTAPSLLAGKTLLLTGVVTPASIAYATAEAALAHGATLVLTAPDRDLARAQETAARLDPDLEVLPLDVTIDEEWDGLAEHLAQRHGHLDGALHAIAYAPAEALDGAFLPPPTKRLDLALDTSVLSYGRLAHLLATLAPPTGGSLVGLTFDADRAWPTYNWMGVLKAALDASNRYAARDLGPRGIRANLVAAGPVQTRAASGIPGFHHLLAAWEGAPLAWDPEDARPVADAVVFLLSDLARAVTGEILHVDGGLHAVHGGGAAG